jgi:hypothetical protein
VGFIEAERAGSSRSDVSLIQFVPEHLEAWAKIGKDPVAVRLSTERESDRRLSDGDDREELRDPFRDQDRDHRAG